MQPGAPRQSLAEPGRDGLGRAQPGRCRDRGSVTPQPPQRPRRVLEGSVRRDPVPVPPR